ncbi:ArsS family sensor histidine kinase [Campylobacter sp. MIT 21-1685]|uniref:ArsS family sensor histidine kinase n=1 Tax=unclassified Campylobacter TaxID=2593542 RepID=UPI00224B4B9D|nr:MULTISPECIES: ArsS family sensor histidine kinase [unclassified Campylobacter]MCX2682498.1 ArsS family sensor histidine kinase [Campylobacter sp. MIT 21-1684]MCX2750789.1 ArsS family sensor histidine kinase [Campylobacter sp. MIT 21-1682]MCX2806979.1 ArsS family sensor histidine kinase [Campylobacter sp. MIT 21-1685]
MTKNYSIYTKLIILFVVVFFLVCVFFIVLLKMESIAHRQEESFRQENLIKSILGAYEHSLGKDIEIYLKNSGFAMLQDSQLIETIREQSQLIFRRDGEFCILSSLMYLDNLYFDVQCKGFEGLFEKTSRSKLHIVLVVSFFIVVIFIYFSILKFLSPLKKLRQQVLSVTQGGQFSSKNYKEHEIAEIALEFEKTLKKNQELVKSRQLFLRTIMHELKTPIGKGRIVTEMIQDEKQRKRLSNIFLGMDSLINEFAKIENLFSKNYNLHIKANRFSTILQEAKKYLMRDDFNVLVKVDLRENPFIKVDIEIFSLIVKNLIDNALKYSSTGKCELYCDDTCFKIINPGKVLAQPIEYYFEAFTREKQQQVQGMGLGLYIVSEVCKLHNFKFLYTYEDNKHCFKVCFKEQ